MKAFFHIFNSISDTCENEVGRTDINNLHVTDQQTGANFVGLFRITELVSSGIYN